MWRHLVCLTLIAIMLPACLPMEPSAAEGTPSNPVNQTNSAPTGLSTSMIEPTQAHGTQFVPGLPQVKTTQPTPKPTRLSIEITPAVTSTEIVTTTTPTAEGSTCKETRGKVNVEEVSTELLPNPLKVRIYLPACYDELTSKHFPVLYLLHGKSFDDTQWERLGVPETADRLIGSGEIAAFIVVMPYDRSWLEPPRDSFGLALEQDLIPWVDEHYRTLPERKFRVIGGLSRGGAWAAHLGFAHPELFGAIGMHSGFVFHSDVLEMQEWLDQLPEGRVPLIYMDIADKDRPEISGSATWLEEMLTQSGIPHEWHMFTGEHVEEYWKAHVEDYLRWYAQGWGD